MKIGVLKEMVSGESRVAATPETVKKMALILFQEIKHSNQTY